MKLIKTEEAAGCVLCHDLTRIVPGVMKGPAFRKGHIVQEEDIPLLLSMGKEHLYVWEPDPSLLHEEEAAQLLATACAGEGLEAGPCSEGKIELFAKEKGLFKVDKEKLLLLNSAGEMMAASRLGNRSVKKGDKVAGLRIIPLVIAKKKIEKVLAALGEGPVFSVLPFVKKRAALLITGNEVAKGLVQDGFGPVVKARSAAYGIEVIYEKLTGDEPRTLCAAIGEAAAAGAQLIFCTGGMSVDPDDRTPAAIAASGAQVVSYGAPVLPGAMFMLAYLNENIAVCGLPGCVMHAPATIFDAVLPRLAAGDEIKREELAALGEGGLCLGCKTCVYPACGFAGGW